MNTKHPDVTKLVLRRRPVPVFQAASLGWANVLAGKALDHFYSRFKLVKTPVRPPGVPAQLHTAPPAIGPVDAAN